MPNSVCALRSLWLFLTQHPIELWALTPKFRIWLTIAKDACMATGEGDQEGTGNEQPSSIDANLTVLNLDALAIDKLLLEIPT